MCYLNGILLTVGGVQTKQVDEYDVEVGVWRQGCPGLTQYRVAHGCCTYENKVRSSASHMD